eukprot:TRINITY_DN55583_c0_g1_i1.p1 TRINITY_DN55583_c0_g1~~TRINITY_DN55583_c0_g1_i1.p1  ORF type:complete len:296 (+),score=25.40 TRINITY_DN55583_c0_g1_i1:85-972(+)
MGTLERDDPFLTHEDRANSYDSDEEDSLLGERSELKELKATASAAYTRLRYTSVAALFLILLYLAILTVRLELPDRWPIFIDFIPLWILPCILYLIASNFASTRVVPGSETIRLAINIVGFIIATGMLVLMVFICFKLSDVIRWSWVTTFSPFWVMLILSQICVAFMAPGLVRADKLTVLFGIFTCVWFIGFAALLACLKLDDQFPRLRWWIIFAPTWVVILAQVAMLEKTPVETLCRLLLLAGLIIVPFRADGALAWNWGVVLTPAHVILMINIALIVMGSPDQKIQSKQKDSL